VVVNECSVTLGGGRKVESKMEDSKTGNSFRISLLIDGTAQGRPDIRSLCLLQLHHPRELYGSILEKTFEPMVKLRQYATGILPETSWITLG